MYLLQISLGGFLRFKVMVRLQCLVAFELKMESFKPEHLGQLNFYLEALDRDVKKPRENPSIGVLLCKDKDNEVVEYALSRSLSPTMVAEYQLCLPDKHLLQQKMRELFEVGCNDALVCSTNGDIYLDFIREAETLAKAIKSAIKDIEMASAKGIQINVNNRHLIL